MDFKWTSEQSNALNVRNTNVLVSAAAGSGKTAILVERIKRLIIEEKVPVTSFLVVTFTNAAASEMKEKIRKALVGALEKCEGDKNFLKKQLDELHKAQVSTFHNFGIKVIRRYFHLVDIDPNFKICDEVQATILKQKALDEFIDSLYQEGGAEFYNFMDSYSSDRNDNKVKKLISSNYEKIMSIPNCFEWLHENVENLKLDENSFEKSNLFEEIIKSTCSDLVRALRYYESANIILAENDLPRLAGKLQDEVSLVEDVLFCAKNKPNFSQIQDMLNQFSPARIVANKDEKLTYESVKEKFQSQRDEAKKIIKDLISSFYDESLESHLKFVAETYDNAKFFEQLINRYHVLYSQAKRENNLIDFNDIEHFALKILENQEAQKEYRNKFQYIFIDEYQDSNFVQEYLINKIKREDNVFMVGDVKQSIYRFRLAVPEIFEEKYKTFAKDKSGKCTKIDLNMNFRSKKSVIDTVNDVFENILRDYNDDAKLYKGDPYNGSIFHETEVHLVDGDEPDEVSEEIADLKNIEKEAIIAAEIIMDNLGEKIWDSKHRRERDVSYKDIVILLRALKGKADIYYNVLKEYNIPVYIDDNEKYFDTIEINTIVNLLMVIDNKKQDIPLVTVLKSEIFGFTIDELIQIRIENKGKKYYEAFLNYCKNGTDSNLKQKCQTTLEKIKNWKLLVQTMPLDDFIWKILLDTNFYIAMGALPGGSQRQANLRTLVDKAQEFINSQIASLSNFIDYVNIIKKKEIKIGQLKMVGEKDDVVRIMSIHKSKGLEFPVVIVGGLGSNIQTDKLFDVAVDTSLGLALKNVDPIHKISKKNLIRRTMQRKVIAENTEDELRVYYVALTRAMDKLILIGSLKNFEKSSEIILNELVSRGSFIQIIGKFLAERNYRILLHPNKEIVNIVHKTNEKSKNMISAIDDAKHISDKKLAEIIDDKLSFEYPNDKALNIKFKYSVTELNEIKKENFSDEYSKELSSPNFIHDANQLSGAKQGTLYHRLMQEIDFSKMDTSSDEQKKIIQETLEYMRKVKIFDEDEHKSIDIVKAIQFFNTEIGKRAVAAAKKGMLYKEKEFTIIADVDGENVLVQGVIDCFFEEEDGYVLVDYKTNYIDDKQDVEKEKDRIVKLYDEQIKIYANAINSCKKKKVKEAYLYLQGIGDFAKVNL